MGQYACMVAIDNIRDEGSFHAWLQETGQSRAACAALAQRAAMRVLPLVWSYLVRHEQFSALPTLRALMVNGIASGAPTALLIRTGTARALRDASWAAGDAAWAAVGDADWDATMATRVATDAIRAARDSAWVAPWASGDAVKATRAAKDAARATRNAAWAAAGDAAGDARAAAWAALPPPIVKRWNVKSRFPAFLCSTAINLNGLKLMPVP